MNIHPFLNNINDICKSQNIDNYRNHPMCFWNVVFMNIFNQFGYSCPSRKGIRTFINKVKEPSVCYVSISNNCKCYIKNSTIKIEFKNLIQKQD